MFYLHLLGLQCLTVWVVDPVRGLYPGLNLAAVALIVPITQRPSDAPRITCTHLTDTRLEVSNASHKASML